MPNQSMERINDALGIEDMKDFRKVWRQLFAEFIGTFLYLATVLLTFTFTLDTSVDVIRVALANGLLVASIVQTIGHVSGGHINPVVTVGASILGYIKPLRTILYILSQILGAISGAAVAYSITTEEMRSTLGATTPDDVSVDRVFAVEFLITFVMVSVYLSVVDPHRGLSGLGSSALAVGLSVTGCQCASLGYSGSLNPARSLGPAVVMGIWSHHWVYWAGPLCGAVAAGSVYRFVFTITNTAYSIE